MKPIILKQKLPTKQWKLIHLFNDYDKLSDFEFKPSNELETYIYNQNIRYVYDLVYKQEKGTVDDYAVYKYVSKLQEVLNKNKLLSSEKQKVYSVIELLNELCETAFMSNYYYPQITMDTTYCRLYYNPLFRFPDKVIKNLIVKFRFINLLKYRVFKLDVNGALVRTVFQILYKITSNSWYKEIYETENDIYIKLKEQQSLSFDRDTLKQNIIKFINKGKVKDIHLLLPDFVVQHINQYIHPNLNLVRKYMTIYSNNNLQYAQHILAPESSFFLFVNLDGGVLVSNQLNVTSIPSSVKSVNILEYTP